MVFIVWSSKSGIPGSHTEPPLTVRSRKPKENVVMVEKPKGGRLVSKPYSRLRQDTFRTPALDEEAFEEFEEEENGEFEEEEEEESVFGKWSWKK